MVVESRIPADTGCSDRRPSCGLDSPGVAGWRTLYFVKTSEPLFESFTAQKVLSWTEVECAPLGL